MAAFLEDAGNRGDAGVIAERVDDFRKSLSNLAELIRSALAARRGEGEREVEARLPDDVTRLLRGLKEALEAEKVGAANKILAELSAMQLDPRLTDAMSEISDLVLVAEFGKAAAAASGLYADD